MVKTLYIYWPDVYEVSDTIDVSLKSCSLMSQTAHYFAWKAGFIHRDISAGNVLIMMIETVDAEGNYFCERDGMLADWELSTTVVPDGEVTGSSQVINRTVSTPA